MKKILFFVASIVIGMQLFSQNAIKLNFLSPFLGYTYLSYERMITSGQGAEVGIGVIGVGTDIEKNNAKGVTLRGGYRVAFDALESDKSIKGYYVMPEIIFGAYKYDEDINGVTKKETNTTFSFNIVGGKQFVLNDIFLVDPYVGLGYSFASNKDLSGFHYGFFGFGKNVPVTITAGLKIGFIF